MKNLFGISVLLLLCGALYAAPSLLARVELGAGRDLAAVVPIAPVVADVGDFCLVRASDAELSSLDARGFNVTVLDRVGDEDCYFV